MINLTDFVYQTSGIDVPSRDLWRLFDGLSYQVTIDNSLHRNFIKNISIFGKRNRGK